MGLFQELKRRNVFRLGIAYVLVAWVLLQVIDFTLEVIAAPDWILQVFVLAAAVGLPIVASEVLRGHEVITEGVNCLFFKPGDKIDLAAKIDALLDDDSLRETLAINNRRIAPQFSYAERAALVIEAMARIQINE